jgi:hypothetical protein
MKINSRPFKATLGATTILFVLGCFAYANQPEVGKSPWGPEDELGRLNLLISAQVKPDVISG